MRPALTLLALVAAIVVALCGGARAHAVLVETNPADGAVLIAAPSEVTLRFNEPVAPVAVRVLTVEAGPVAGTLAADGGALRIRLPPALAHGVYVVSYRVISADSHPVSGSFSFVVGEAPAGWRTAPVADGETGLVVGLAAARALFTAALLVFAGGILALWGVAGFDAATVHRVAPVLRAAALVAMASGVLMLGLLGVLLAGGPSFAGPAGWRAAVHSPLGLSLAVAAPGLVAGWFFTRHLAAGDGRAMAVLAAALTLASFGFTGHAATSGPAWLMRPAVALHAACAAFWLGSLPVLGPALRLGPQTAHRILARFSALAVPVAAVLLGLGALLAIRQVEHVDLLWQTPYGLVLAAKLVAVAALLALAAVNKWRLMPRLAAHDRGAVRALWLSIRAEYLLFAAVLALTAALGQLQPPRALVLHDAHALQAGQAAFAATAADGRYRITLLVTPARAGHNGVAVEVQDDAGRRVDAKEAMLELALPSAGIEPLQRRATREASGRFVYHGTDLAPAGRWRVVARVLIDDFTQASAVFEVPVR